MTCAWSWASATGSPSSIMARSSPRVRRRRSAPIRRSSRPISAAARRRRDVALLELNDVHTYYGAIHALRGVSISVEDGEIVTLIGSNGAGKSTTLRTISGLLRPRQGTVSLGDKRLDGLRPHQIVQLGVCQSPEGRRVFARMTVHENLEMGAFSRKEKTKIASDFERVYGLFPRLKERTAQRAGTLSGGEQQMLAIARALMAAPRVLLLDEPSMGLAPILAFFGLAIIKPWGGTASPLRDHSRSPAPRSAAADQPSGAAGPTPVVDRETAIADECHAPYGWRIVTNERWQGREVRIWWAVSPVTSKSAFDPTIPYLSIVSDAILQLGYCAPLFGPDRPSSTEAVGIWRIDPGAQTAEAIHPTRIAPPFEDSLVAIWAPPGSATAGEESWP